MGDPDLLKVRASEWENWGINFGSFYSEAYALDGHPFATL
jgi:hypothetical protein